MSIFELRNEYHNDICSKVLFVSNGIPNISDKTSVLSCSIARSIVEQLDRPTLSTTLKGQSAGRLFEELTRRFLSSSFLLLEHLRPGTWEFSVAQISRYEQYEHLADLQRLLEKKPELKAALGGDYLIMPDIIVARKSITDTEINRYVEIINNSGKLARLTPLRSSNRPKPTWILHASISCKWTIRSDRAQNIRTEGLNLIRHRKGHTPHIVAVTAEPLPTRLASLALGTGDLDCVYHFALPELQVATEQAGGSEQTEMLLAMIEGRRLRDISDLPFDLAI